MFGRKPQPTEVPKHRTPRYSDRAIEADQDKGASGTFTSLVGHWWDRVISSIFSGGLAQQSSQYLAHQTKRDYLANIVGQSSWGALFPLLTVVCSQLVGVEQAGLFSMAFVVGMLLLFVAQYGVRTFQVSDLDEMQSFSDYQAQRLVTCIGMVLAGLTWCFLRGYGKPMLSICTGIFAFRFADGMADVYEGRLQQKDKLYLAGISQALRCILGFLTFSIVLLITRNLAWATWAMGLTALLTLVAVTIPLALLETEKSTPLTLRGIKRIFVQCWPLFLGLFLYNLIDSIPKFAMEISLSYDNQLYFNALYFPAHMILMLSILIYRPQLVRLANIWENPDSKHRFGLVVFAMLGVIILITAVTVLFVDSIGIPLNTFLYGVDFESYRGLARVMVITGGICAGIDYLYQIITILRAQKSVTRIYLISVIIAVPVVFMMVSFDGLNGAVIGSFTSMSILFLLLISDYISLRHRQRHE